MNISAISAAGPLLYAANLAPLAPIVNRSSDSVGKAEPAIIGGKGLQVQDQLDLSPISAVAPPGRVASDSTKPVPSATPSEPSIKSGQPKDDEQTGQAGEDGQTELSEEEQEQVQQLKERDREVRTHEQAHKSAAGPYARGGPTYDYQRGPDGQNYAIGGSVEIDTSPVEGDPEATIQKAQVVKAAALAPAEPSAQDRKVAAAASRMLAQAQSELIAERSQFSPDSDAATGSGSGSWPASPASSPKHARSIEAGAFLDLLA